MVKGQNSIYPFKNFTTDNGLPSNECHRILQDKKGYIWIVTDRGLCRYDGYNFKRYGKSEGLTDVAVMNMQLDKDENIWMTTISKNVFIYQVNSDSIVPYKYNHLLEKYKKHSNSLLDFHVDKDLNLFLIFWGHPIIKIDSTGILTINYEKVSDNFIKVIEIENKLKLNVVSIDTNFIFRPFYKLNNECSKFVSVGFLDVEHKKLTDLPYNNKSLLKGFTYGYKDKKTILLSFFDASYVFHKSKLVNYNFETIRSIISTPLGYIGLNATRKDVSLYPSLEDIVDNKPISKLLEGVDPSHILLDREGDLWISTLNHGIFKINLHNVKLIESTKSEKITGLIHDNKKNLIYINDKKSIERIDLSKNTTEILVANQSETNMLLFDKVENNLIVATEKSYILKNGTKYYMKHTYKDLKHITTSIKYIYQDDLFHLIAINGIYIISYKNQASIYQAPPIYNHPTSQRINAAVSYSDGSLILGTNEGLYLFNENNITKFEVCTDLLNGRINDIKKYGMTYYLATMGNGLVVWDGHDNFQQITTRDGMVSDNIERLHIDEKGNVYACTYNGLSILKQKSDKKYHMENYSTYNGLPSNEVNEVTTIGDQIYVATSKGIAVISGQRPVAQSHKPLIVNTTINGAVIALHSRTVNHTENNINIEFHTIDYNLEGKIIYRYKVNNDAWQTTSSTQLNLVDLSPGKYMINIQSMNSDSKWSESTSISFTIRKPFWKTWYFRLGVLALMVFLVYRLIKNAINRIKENTNIQTEISNLQRSALQAQMNPHFIFNCLNSIQNFIMQNEKLEAMEYLNRFAHLIRQNLQASTENMIRLDDELSMLENYIALEKMRFDKRFDYTISIADDIDTATISIPPLLVQPFVENAIIHGVSSLPYLGWINIDIFKVNDKIRITIADNGKGIQKSKTHPDHKSFGMSITQKRLAFINQQQDGLYTIETTSDENGTKITIHIPVE